MQTERNVRIVPTERNVRIVLTCKSKVVEKEESTQGKRGYIRNGAIVAVLRWSFDGRDVHEPAAASLAVGVAFQGDTQRSAVVASDVCDVIATAHVSMHSEAAGNLERQNAGGGRECLVFPSSQHRGNGQEWVCLATR